MFRKKNSIPTAQLDSPGTVIGRGVFLEAARLTGKETIRIDGEFTGAIDVDGSLVLGQDGVINGDVAANYFLVAGEMNGNVTCATQLHFASTARVVGDIQTASLVMDEGSQVSGRYCVGENRHSNRDNIVYIESTDRGIT